MIRIICAAVVSLTVMSCSSSDNPTAEADNSVARFAGDYSATVTATAPTSTDGGTCGDASGDFVVADGTITGTAQSTNGFMFDITGNVTSAGDVTGGFAVSGTVEATYTGAFTDNMASGTWEENSGCAGTWQAEKTL